MTQICYWRLRGRASGGRDGKIKGPGVVSDSRGGMSYASIGSGAGNSDYYLD